MGNSGRGSAAVAQYEAVASLQGLHLSGDAGGHGWAAAGEGERGGSHAIAPFALLLLHMAIQYISSATPSDGPKH